MLIREKAAAVTIQAVHRGNVSRAAVDQKAAGLEIQQRTEDVQSFFQQQQQTAAAVRIECLFRYYLARKCHQQLLEERKLREVSTIAEAWSPMSSASPVASIRAEQTMAAATLQSWWRMILVRLWMAYWRFCKETMAAVKLQAWVRMIVAMKDVGARKRERRASLTIEM